MLAVNGKTQAVLYVAVRGEVHPLRSARHIAEHVVAYREVEVGVAHHHVELAYYLSVRVREHGSEPCVVQSRPSHLLHALHVHAVGVHVGSGGDDVLVYHRAYLCLVSIHACVLRIEQCR